MEQEQFEKTPAKANRWFRIFIMSALLYGITFSLGSFFNWIFFLGAVYSLFMSYYRLPVQPKIFQNRARATRASFDREGQPTINVDQPADKIKKAFRIIGISIGGLVFLIFIIGLFSNDDQSTTTTSDSPDPDTSEQTDNSAHSITDTANNLFNAGNIDSADYLYTKALEIDPDFMEAVYGKGLVLYNRGSKDEANANFVRAYEGGYRFYWLSWVLADTNDKAGNTTRAIELYKEAVNLDSTNVDSYTRLAELVPGERDKYLKLFEKYDSN